MLRRFLFVPHACHPFDPVSNVDSYLIGKNFSFTWGLHIQRDNVATCQAARKKNACGSSNPNYCSVKRSVPLYLDVALTKQTRFHYRSNFPSGYSCDEYPFASTKEGQTVGNAATRCVPKGQNSSQ